MTRIRMTLLSMGLVALATAFSGCDPGTPKFDAATAYSADTLAQELILRFRALKPSSPASKKPDPSSERALTRSKESTKASRPATLDALLDDIASKTNLVKGMERPQVLKQVADAVNKDKTLSADQKKSLADGLEARGR